MGDWYDTFDSVFWLSLSVGLFGFLGIALRYCIKSKCTDCNLCFGLLQVRRDTKSELEESEFEIEHNVGVAPQTNNRV
jgi:hypothetical protein